MTTLGHTTLIMSRHYVEKAEFLQARKERQGSVMDTLAGSGSVAAEWTRTLRSLERGRREAAHGVCTVWQQGDAAGWAHAVGGPAMAV
jgi:hypothetical protein